MYHQNTAYDLCMPDRPLSQDFRVQIPEQLPMLLQGFRKAAGLTQAEAARRLGVTQQTFSSLERNAHRMSAERLMALLSLLGVSLVLRQDRAEGAAVSVASAADHDETTPASASPSPITGSSADPDPFAW
jgi:putative transcription regulator protein